MNSNDLKLPEVQWPQLFYFYLFHKQYVEVFQELLGKLQE